MAETHAPTVAEAAKPSAASRAPATIQRSPNFPDGRPLGAIQRAIDSGSPSIAPNSFGRMIGELPDGSSQARAVNQLQSNYGNSYVRRMIQRKCDCGTCPNCSEKKPIERELSHKIQRQGEGQISAVPAAVGPAIQRSGGGSPLSPATRSMMESRFGEDFGDVRIHDDGGANEAAGEINAQAFTTGSDIYLGRGRSPTESPESQKLIAHELTHVVQQRQGAVGGASSKPVIDAPGDSFEREADAAATSVMAGNPVRVGSGCGSPSVQRAGCPDFVIPGEKGGYAQIETRYRNQLNTKGLKVRTDVRQTSTDTLRRRWLDKKGYSGKLAELIDTSKPREKNKFPLDNEGRYCTVDHIVEWILHGNNTDKSEDADNMMLMAGRRNKGAGGRVLGQINKLPGNCKSFSDFVADSPDPPDECMKIDLNFDEWLKLKQGGESDKLFTIKFKKADIPLDLTKAAQAPGPKNSTLYTSKAQILMRARKQAKGEESKAIIFDEINLQIKDEDLEKGGIDARISDKVAYPFVGPATKVDLIINPPDHRVVLADTKYQGKFPGLSEAIFNFKTNEEGELEGEARMVPSKPILNKTVIHLIVKDDKLSARLQVPVKELNLPVPGLTLSGDGLILGFEDGEFYASGQVILQYGTFARGELNALATKKGFSASGKIDLTIPGIDKAGGKIWLDTEGKVGGEIEVGSSQLKIPGVKKANIKITIQDGVMTGDGIVQLGIPGIKQGRLGVTVDKDGNYAITGVATLDVPGLKAAEIGLTYRNGELEGLAKVGMDIPGLEGAGAAFEIKYAKGVVTGVGDFTYKKGKLAGKVHAELNEKRKLIGSGELAYEIIPGLVAAVGIELREDGTAKISGELRIPEQIDLFAEKAIEKTLFSFGLQIPIFAIPLGTRSVGLVAEIGADLKARAGIGPGQIRKLKVKASFDPAQEESAFEFAGGGELYVPAFAELSLGVHGGIGLSLAIASATGGIELRGALGLRGALSAMVEIAYKNNQFSVDALAELSAQPSIKFDVNAYVKVDVSLLVTTIEVYRKDWNLASKEWGSGLKIGLRFPVHYVFGQPFEISLSQVEFIVPDIDATQAVKDLLLG
jgi:hypothetical protein